MNWLRRQRGFVRILLVVMLTVQFAGVLASPLAHASPAFNGAHQIVHHQHVHGTAGLPHQQRDHKAAFSEHCCALHAIFVGIIAQAAVPETRIASFTRIALATEAAQHVSAASRLDRPPRSFV
ncbi:hypothetical protein ACTG4Q_39265 (plasmid) [Bradyrhizobium denitrificans]